MSSFMLTNQSLSAIGKEVERLETELGADYGFGADAKTITKGLYNLNAAGVRARYEDADKDEIIHPFEFINHQLPLEDFQFLKSLKCLRYQAIEGEIPGREDFKNLERLISDVAEKIATGLPAYARAKWD